MTTEFNSILFWWEKIKAEGAVSSGLSALNEATGKTVKHNRLAEYANGTVSAPSIITRWINEQIAGDVLRSEGVEIEGFDGDKIKRIANKLSPPIPRK